MQLALRNSASKIRATFTGSDGEAAAPTNPTVTITRDSDGVEVVTGGVATSEGVGLVTFTLAAANIPTVDLLRVEWGGTGASAPDDEVGVVGGFLCTLEAISTAVVAAGGVAPNTLTLRRKRTEAERRLEDACHVAFRPSYARESLKGDGTTELLLTRPRSLSVLKATIDGVVVTGEVSLASDGTAFREAGWPHGADVALTYVHGWPTTPEPVSDAAVTLAAALAQGGGDGRVTRFREDDQEFFLSVPGPGGATGIPEVDRVISDYGYSVVA